MSTRIHISDEVIEKAQQDHLLFLLEDTLNAAVQAEIGTYYPLGSFLAMLPSDADLEKARATVISEALRTNYANLVPENSGLHPIFEKKDALHRAFLSEAIDHIDTHLEEISSELLGGAVPTEILALTADGADSHNDSRHTMVVQTDAGAFLYKPRCLKTDMVIRSLCDKLFPGIFRVPQAIDCTTFGFTEYIENIEPVSTDELNDYFSALGTYCALAYFLSLSDQHAENFLSQGPRLVPIDLESVFASAFSWAQQDHCSDAATLIGKGATDSAGFSHDMARSITSTGMLSCKYGNLYGAILAGTLHKIEPINACYASLDHKEQIISGFEQGYKTCLENKDSIREAVMNLQDTRMRVILESTMFYHLLLKRLFNVSVWNDSDGCKELQRYLHSTAHAKLGDAVVESETTSILKGDYPAFYFTPKGRDLYDGAGVVTANYLSRSPLSIALERLDTFGQEDLHFQSGILKKSIEDIPLMAADKPAPIEVTSEAMVQEAAREEAARILSRTYQDIIPGQNSLGGLWATNYGETQRTAMDCSLGTGYAGVGVFAAACMASQAGNPRHAEALLNICLHELSCYVQVLQSQSSSFARRSMGLADGIGGIIQALQLIWIYTHDKRVSGIYESLLHSIDVADFTATRGNNIYNGLAGLLLPLANSVPGLPECACIESIADTLLSSAILDSNGHYVWMEPDGVCGELGYGKGTGGIGLAFLRSWQATGIERFRDVCCNALAYEDAEYSAELGFWPLKAQAKTKKISPPGICRGVSGQALVFTQAAQAGVPLAQQNAERARLCALVLPPEQNDNLCCGTSAIVEGLITLGCHEEAGRLLKAQVARKNKTGFYISENTTRAPFFNPCLFYGCLGVGYELLHYGNPTVVKSIFL